MVQIPDAAFNEILSSIGYPFIREEDIEINFAEIKETLIAQAIKEYFRWFPIQEEHTLGVAGTFSIPFPDDNTYGASEFRIVTGRGRGGAYGNPLVDERFIRVGGLGRRMYGTRNTYGFDLAIPSVRSEAQSVVNTNRAWRARVNFQEKKVEGFSNVPATLVFLWSKYSLDWSDIRFEQEFDVIKLAQSFVMNWFALLRSQETTQDVPITFAIDSFKEQARALRDEVLNKWKQYIKAVIIRT